MCSSLGRCEVFWFCLFVCFLLFIYLTGSDFMETGVFCHMKRWRVWAEQTKLPGEGSDPSFSLLVTSLFLSLDRL